MHSGSEVRSSARVDQYRVDHALLSAHVLPKHRLHLGVKTLMFKKSNYNGRQLAVKQ